MKAEVIKAFYDLQDPARTVYQVGSSFEGETKRVKDLEKRGFVKAIEEKEQKPAARRTTASKKKGC